MSGRGYTSKLSPEDYYLAAVGAGRVPGMSHNNWNMYKTAVNTTEPSEVIDWANSYTFPSDLGEEMTIVSTVAETSTVTIDGLDEDFKRKTVTVTLNSTTPVAIGKFTRVNEVMAITTFTGVITVAGLNVYCVAYPAQQQSLGGIYSIPTDETAFFMNVTGGIVKVTGGAASDAVIRLRYRSVGGPFRISFFLGLITNGASVDTVPNFIPEAVPGPADFTFTAQSSAANTSLYIRSSLLLEKK